MNWYTNLRIWAVKKMQQAAATRLASKILALLPSTSPRIISMLDGGLASQMWQFALGYSISKATGLPLYLDISWYSNQGTDIKGRKNRHLLLLTTFPHIRQYIKDRIITDKKKIRLFSILYSDKHVNRKLFEFTPMKLRPLYIGQYYCNINYISRYREELADLFFYEPTLNKAEQDILQIIQKTTSCALHIRKGDFVGSVHDVCSDNYYLAAMNKMKKLYPSVTFILFTNDEKWSRNFIESNGYSNCCHIIENRSEHSPETDLWLMQQCEHAIISNSGFSFMPAFLSARSNKNVITPEYWLKTPQGDYRKDSYGAYLMDGWMTLKN